MRTTITIADDVAEEMARLRRSEGLGPSEALNLLARRGMAQPAPPTDRYQLRPRALGARVDLSNTAEVLDLLDQEG